MMKKRFFFSNAAAGLGLQNEGLESINEMISAEKLDIDVQFINKQQSLFFIREALQLCYIDGSYDDKEKEIVEQIRKNNSLQKKIH